MQKGLWPAVLALAAMAWAHPAVAKDKDNDKDDKKGQTTEVVTVANTPLPVTLPGNPGVTITNTPSVTITNTPSVTITNTPSAPVPVVSLDAAGAFQVQLTLSQAAGTLFQTVNIPAGKRLVVEFVTIDGTAASSSGPIQPVVLLESSITGVGSANFYLQPDQAATLTDRFARSEQVKVYADGLAVAVGFAGYTPDFMVFGVSISGHLVPAP